MERGSRSASDLNRPDWNSLEENYEAHDIGELHVKRHFEHMGFRVENWGIDKRHDDGALVYDDKMDLKIYGREPSSVERDYLTRFNDDDDDDEDGGGVIDVVGDCTELAGVIEVKTKRNEDWYGVINARHLRKYVTHAESFDVPAVVYMAFIDEDYDGRGSSAIVRDTFIPLQPCDDAAFDDDVTVHPQVTRSFQAPDGNQVVKLDVDTGVGWRTVQNTFISDCDV